MNIYTQYNKNMFYLKVKISSTLLVHTPNPLKSTVKNRNKQDYKFQNLCDYFAETV